MGKKTAPVKFGIWTVLRQAPYEELGERYARWVLVCPKGHEVTLTGYAAYKLRTSRHGRACPRCLDQGATWSPGQLVGGHEIVARVGDRIESVSWRVRCPKCGKECIKSSSALARNKRGCRRCGWVTYDVCGVPLTLTQMSKISGVNDATLYGRMQEGLSPLAAMVHARWKDIPKSK